MSSTLNVPPRRTAAVNVITNPAASLPSSKMAARDRAQSWRGKYLRALNICSDDIEAARRNAEKTAHDGKARVRAMSFHRSDFADHVAFSRSYSSSTEKEDEERKSLERSSRSNQRREARPSRVPLRAPSTDVGSATLPMMSNTTNPYGFPIRPSMSRGRRCHTDPFMLEERVSAPIQIPSAMGVTSQLDGNMRHDPFTRRRASPQSIQGEADVATNNHSATNVRLLSWEEPVAMLAAADAVSKGWRMPHASAMSSMELGVRRSRDEDDELGLHHMDDEDDDHDGDIFEMDECEEDNNQKETKSRRRYRTESMNTVTSGREKRTHHAYDEFGTNDLSQSFVPPHELVNRSDCFSIGLRDELKKRRPAHHQAHI